MKTNILLIALMLLASCNPVRSNRGGAPALKQTDGVDNLRMNFEEPLAYLYNGDNCTTGRITFKTQEELCIGLQDDELNNQCAEALRRSRFNNVCDKDLGWKWKESTQCEVYVMKKDSAFPEVRPQDVISKRTFCAGRSEISNWQRLDDLKVNDFDIWMGNKFAIEIKTQEHDISFLVTTKLTSADGLQSSTGSHFGDVISSEESDLYDHEERIRVNCHPAPGCRKN